MAKLTAKQQQIYDFILAFLREHGYPPSVREIGSAVGLKSPSTVHFHIKGLEDAGVLVKAEGKTRALSVAGATLAQQKESAAHHRQVPVLGNVAAGTPILAQEYIEDYVAFDTNGLTGEHFALKVRGDSMCNAGILPGDFVVVHQQNEARNGDIVVALFEEEATVKRLNIQLDQVWLMPENEAYAPIDGRNAQIIGKVVGVVRHY